MAWYPPVIFATPVEMVITVNGSPALRVIGA